MKFQTKISVKPKQILMKSQATIFINLKQILMKFTDYSATRN